MRKNVVRTRVVLDVGVRARQPKRFFQQRVEPLDVVGGGTVGRDELLRVVHRLVNVELLDLHVTPQTVGVDGHRPRGHVAANEGSKVVPVLLEVGGTKRTNANRLSRRDQTTNKYIKKGNEPDMASTLYMAHLNSEYESSTPSSSFSISI